MRIKHFLTFMLIFHFSNFNCLSQTEILYKDVNTIKLYMQIYTPDNFDSINSFPALIFFFGGGWEIGDKEQFKKHAEYFSKRGIVCFLVDYRIRSIHQSSPFEALMDAKSAIRYVRKNAERYNVDTARIIASGGSAGGHLAAATALIDDFNEKDDLSVSCKPNALILFNPVIDNSPGGFGFERIGNEYKRFSPLHNIKKGIPPTIIFLGTKDKIVPVETVKYFQKSMEKVGSKCELKLYEGEEHGFFNYRNLNNYYLTIIEMDRFLQTLRYLNDEPKIKLVHD